MAMNRDVADVASAVDEGAPAAADALRAAPVVGEPYLRAYRIEGGAPFRLAPAPVERGWMEQMHRWPYRCLPMVIANQAGWVVLNTHAVFVRWDGGNEPTSIK